MSISPVLFGMSVDEIMEDVYFQSDFVELHSCPNGIDQLEYDGFHHAAAVREIPGTKLEDLETPWGYGGPVGRDFAALSRGVGLWRERQAEQRRVAEFIRLHPFLNPVLYYELLSELRFDRPTIVIDLARPAGEKWRTYSKSTRYSIKQAQKRLSIRPISAREAGLFRELYEAGLARNDAGMQYYHSPRYFEALLAAPWTRAWVAELEGKPLAAACFLHRGKLVHYHLSGGTQAARENFAHYALLNLAIEKFASEGKRWMHLGGGRTARSDDELYRFKAKFSSKHIPFYVGSIIHDENVYRRLGGHRNNQLLGYRFPPSEIAVGSTIAIRQACREDAAAFFRLRCDVENIIWSGHAAPPDWSNLASWFEAQIESSSRRIYVAEQGDEVVGYAYLDGIGDLREVSIGVASNYASRGIGRRFLDKLVTHVVKSEGAKFIEAWIVPENVASIKAFEAAGFVFAEHRGSRAVSLAVRANSRSQLCWSFHRNES